MPEKNNLCLMLLDFDGVLFDTVREAYCVALIAFGKAAAIRDISFATDHYMKFRAYRYLITSAATYLPLLKALEESPVSKAVDEAFQRLSLDSSVTSLKTEFEHKFFHVRSELKKNDYEQWLRLNEPYPFFFLMREQVKVAPDRIYIITTKDEETVQQLLNLHDFPFRKEQILDRKVFNRCKSKRNIIKLLLRETGASAAIFIDDSQEHLKECRGISSVMLLQPDWGYVAPGDETAGEDEIMEKIMHCMRR